jgi:Fic family protein
MNMQNFISGKWATGYKYKYFLPEIIDHEWVIADTKLHKKLEKASFSMGALNSLAKFTPAIDLFIQSYVMKEAVTSSRIEGTKTGMEEAFSDELSINPEKRNDWHETIQYREAMNYAIKRLKKLPLSNRLIRETHKILLSQVRDKHKNPGEFRKSQNWIGGATINEAVYVPPSYEHVEPLMSDLEKFLHNDIVSVPHLIKIAIAHYQFETIHPFLDGNGRIGRLLITLYLVSSGMLEKPLLYTSDFFEKHKGLYIDKLNFTREKNDLSGWINFFLQAVDETSSNAAKSLKEILSLKDSLTINKIVPLGRRAKNSQRLLDFLFTKPVITSNAVCNKLDLTPKSANDLIAVFAKLGILKENTGYKRNRNYSFSEYLKILKK